MHSSSTSASSRHIDGSSAPTAKNGAASKLTGQCTGGAHHLWSPEDKLDSYQNSSTVRRRKSAGTAETHSEALHVHGNLMLKMAEQCRMCRCWKRWQLAILANIGFMIVFGIRCNFGAAKNHMSKDYIDPWGNKHRHSYNWTSAELGVMESSFFYGYLITQIPAGFLAAKFAANKMFGVAIGGASFLNILLPYAFRSRSDSMVALVQIAQGLVQGLAYPAMHGVWCHWAPPLERSKLATTAFTGSYAGAVFGLPLSAWLVSYVHWSMPFYIYGIAGVIWTFFWFSMTFEKPAFHPTITVQEKQYIEAQIGPVNQTHPTFFTIPWRAILSSKPNQLTYMRDVLDLRISDSGLIAALPHAVMGCVVLLGGRLADYLRSNKILSTTAVRKLFNCGGFGCEALFLLVVAYTKDERTAMIAMIIAVGCSGFAISGFNVNHLDIAPRYAAILMGFSNGIGTLAGLTCPFVVESLTSKGNTNGWVTVFLLASLIHFTGITFYAVYASGELQEWAEPKPGEVDEAALQWDAQKAAEARALEAAGKRGDTYGTNEPTAFEPLPHLFNSSRRTETAPLNMAGPAQNAAASNPFLTNWGDDTQHPKSGAAATGQQHYFALNQNQQQQDYYQQS
uniref:Major facilitator superfamily (MFS) profile domain-containing protein n=1 Tax=Globodera rostochiensis TaxID=31243 RepID=A0A914HVT9_GLORO